MSYLPRSRPAALSIAGSDPCGGAGVQMDIKVFEALGVYGAAAVTAVTVQNSCGVRDVFPVPARVVRDQVEAVMDDISFNAVKCGMLWSGETVQELAALFGSRQGFRLVIDPVLASTSGKRLLDEAGAELLAQELLCRADLVTPNIPEACILSGMPIKDKADMVEAAMRIWHRSGKRCAVLIKGGHSGGSQVLDVLFCGDGVKEFRGERLQVGEVHGTGCALSAAVTAYLARGAGLTEAVGSAKEFLMRAMKRALKLGRGVLLLDVAASREEQG